jgi:hypothetical protein
MAFKLDWKPVLQAVALKDYHPDYADNVIQVCVNPQPAFWQERTDLMKEFERRSGEAQKRLFEMQQQQQPPDASIVSAFTDWSENEFMPMINDWYARLWSFGSDPWTVADVNVINETDSHLLTWLKDRSIELIEDHRLDRKKK